MDSDSSRRRKSAERAVERHALPVHQSRSRQTRTRILEAAERAFAEKGYDGARLSDIAEDAECSVGAVYFRFKDKSALFLAIAESFTEDARAALKDLLPAAGRLDRDDVLRQFVAGAARSFRKHKGLFRAVVERGLEHPRVMNSIFELRDEFADALERVLTDAAAAAGRRATVSRTEVSLRVRVMTQMIYGFLLAGVLNPKAPTDIADARALNELADACVAYLGKGAK